jgi:tetraacyldisaccharide 4'-kinase
MHPPDFWYPKEGAALPLGAKLLAPVSALYARISRRRTEATRPTRATLPVICVGNITAGGTGKTPVALCVAEILVRLGRRPVFLTRGYGGQKMGPLRVDPALHSAADIGDEPLLLAARAPTIVARDRVAGATLAAEHGDIIVMDDGFQNPSLVKDLSLVVIDAPMGFGNERLIPAGPLREPVATGLARANAALLLGEGPVPPALAAANIPVIRGWLAPLPETAESLRGRRIAAFAGIGRPEKFFETLRQIGAGTVFATPFPDHHPYRDSEIAALRSHAGTLRLITTEKDFVRLKPHQRKGIEVLPVTVSFEDEHALEALLAPFSVSATAAPDRASH